MTEASNPSTLEGRTTSRGRRSSGFRATAARWTDVRPGEGWKVVAASLTLGGIVAAHVALETARDALFLTEFGAHHLAFVYIAMALLAAVVGRFGLAIERALGRANALILSLMSAALGTMLFYVSDLSGATTFGLYLWTGLSGTLLMLQFWLFAATRFDGAQGRRLYGLIAAGGVLGAVLGGVASTAITRWLNVESLLALAASEQLITALLVTGAPKGSVAKEAEKPIGIREAFRKLRRHPYISRIRMLTGISTVALLCTDYLFKSVSAANVAPAELGTFLAGYYTSMNAAALIIQVFIAVKVLQRAGTIFTLTLLPIGLLLASGAPFLVGSILTGALLAKGVDGALRHSLHRVSVELLYLPLSPGDRSSAKSLIDSVVVRGAQGIAGIGLLGLAVYNLDTPRNLFLIVGGASLLWLGVALSLRTPYLNQFREALGRPRVDGHLHLDQLTLDGVEVVVESLSSPDENRVLSAMALFEGAGRTGLIPALLLYHPSENVLLRSLGLIPSHDRKDWPPLAERLLTHDSDQVRLAAVRALGRFGHLGKLDPESFENPRVRATAAFFQADRLEDPAKESHIRSLLTVDADPGAQAALLHTISEEGSPRWADVLLELKNVDAPELAKLLPRTMTRVRDPRFLPALLRRLGKREGGDEVRAALVALGAPAFDALTAKMHDPETPLSTRLKLPRAIAEFNHRAASDLLVHTLLSDQPGAVRYKALTALGSLAQDRRLRPDKNRILPLVEKNGNDGLKSLVLANLVDEELQQAPASALASGRLLVDLLLDKHLQSVERVARLLKLVHPREDLRQVQQALTKSNPQARSAAGELLEVITLGYDETLRETLRSLADPAPTSDKMEHILDHLGLEFSSSSSVLRTILQDPDPAVSALAANFAEKIEMLEVAVEVQTVLRDNLWLKKASS